MYATSYKVENGAMLVPYMEPTVIFPFQLGQLWAGLTLANVRDHTDLFNTFPRSTPLIQCFTALNQDYLFLEAMERFLKAFPDLRMKCHGIHLYSDGFIISIIGHEASRKTFNSHSAMSEWFFDFDNNELMSYDGKNRVNCPFYAILLFSDSKKAKKYLNVYQTGDLNLVEEFAGLNIPVEIILDIEKPDHTIIPAGQILNMTVGEPYSVGFDCVIIDGFELCDIETVARSVRLA